MGIVVSREGKRGCGYRKVGGTYLISGGAPRPCGVLPLELCTCPTCGAGIKQTRGWTWVDPSELFKDRRCAICDAKASAQGGAVYCRFTRLQHAGLLWIGEKFYSTPEEYTAEAHRMGISRRIKAVPRDYVPGETWILLAHSKVDFSELDARHSQENPDAAAMIAELPRRRPAIFAAFLPERIERIVNGDESEEEIAKIEKAGLVPVKVERLGENLELEINDEEEGEDE